MRAIDITVLVLWLGFWAYWLAMAARVKRDRSRPVGFFGARIAIVVVIAVLIRSNLTVRGLFGAETNPALQAAGVAVLLTGLAAAVWARRTLGANWGMPMSQKLDPELVTSGPYRYIRHPIYAAFIVAMIGTTLAVGLFWLPAAVLACAYFVYSAFVEEGWLSREFPEAFAGYKRSTKMLVPFLL